MNRKPGFICGIFTGALVLLFAGLQLVPAGQNAPSAPAATGKAVQKVKPAVAPRSVPSPVPTPAKPVRRIVGSNNPARPALKPGAVVPAGDVAESSLPKRDPRALPKIGDEEVPGTFNVDREYLKRFSYPRSTLKIQVRIPKDAAGYDATKVMDEAWRARREYGVVVPVPQAESTYKPGGAASQPTPVYKLPGQ
jgi:hypothetical protein